MDSPNIPKIIPSSPVVIPAESGDSAIMNTPTNGNGQNNVAFELILSPARTTASPLASKVLQSPSVASSPRTMEEIAAKLKTAEENRERLNKEKLEKIKEHVKCVSDVHKMTVEKKQATEKLYLENSLNKLAMAQELRQQRMEGLMQKLKEHDNHIDEVRKRMGANKGETNGEELQRELDDATACREMVMEAIQEKNEQNGCENGSKSDNGDPKA